jgi:hypothetical protein
MLAAGKSNKLLIAAGADSQPQGWRMPQQQEIGGVMSAFTEKGGATSNREDRRAWLLVAVGCRVEQRNEAAPQLGGHDAGRVGSQLWDRRVAAASSEVNAWPWARQAPALGDREGGAAPVLGGSEGRVNCMDAQRWMEGGVAGGRSQRWRMRRQHEGD